MDVDPSHIMQIGSGFWPSTVRLSAVELELFTHLGSESFTGQEIGEKLGLNPRAIWDFLDPVPRGFRRPRQGLKAVPKGPQVL